MSKNININLDIVKLLRKVCKKLVKININFLGFENL